MNYMCNILGLVYVNAFVDVLTTVFKTTMFVAVNWPSVSNILKMVHKGKVHWGLI